MKSYQSHKVVKAGKIIAFDEGVPVPYPCDGPLSGGRTVGIKFIVEAADGSEERVNTQMDVFSRGRAALGDYLVQYEDGYVSWSPADVFENGYKEIKPSRDEIIREMMKSPRTRVESGDESVGTVGYPGEMDTESLIEDEQLPDSAHGALPADDQWPPRAAEATGFTEAQRELSRVRNEALERLLETTTNINTRVAMMTIREDSQKQAACSGQSSTWSRAWLALADAADHLDAMMARSEAIPCEAANKDPEEKDPRLGGNLVTPVCK